jgi:hypothetical protein
MVKNIVRSSLVVLVLGFAACDEAPTTAPVTDGETVFEASFDVTGPPDGGSCPNVFYEESELLDNGVTVTWTTVLAGFEYTVGADYLADVNWSVDQGSATYVDFTDRSGPKTWTPWGKNKPDVDGTMTPGADGAGTVAVTVTMTPMHAAAEDTDGDGTDEWAGQIGNGHFWLRLEIDDGEGNIERVKLGVNFHLEDPADGYGDNCPT